MADQRDVTQTLSRILVVCHKPGDFLSYPPRPGSDGIAWGLGRSFRGSANSRRKRSALAKKRGPFLSRIPNIRALATNFFFNDCGFDITPVGGISLSCLTSRCRPDARPGARTNGHDRVRACARPRAARLQQRPRRNRRSKLHLRSAKPAPILTHSGPGAPHPRPYRVRATPCHERVSATTPPIQPAPFQKVPCPECAPDPVAPAPCRPWARPLSKRFPLYLSFPSAPLRFCSPPPTAYVPCMVRGPNVVTVDALLASAGGQRTGTECFNSRPMIRRMIAGCANRAVFSGAPAVFRKASRAFAPRIATGVPFSVPPGRAF